MKRHLLIVAIFLLAGAVVNVAVAWGCVIRPMILTSGSGPIPAVGLWPFAVPREWPSAPSFVVTRTSLGVSVLQGLSRDLEFHYRQWSLRAGLPFRSLYLVRNRTEEQGTRYGALILERPIRWQEGIKIPQSLFWRLSSRDSWGRNLPTMPVWPGFLVNTILYAVVPWLLVCGPFALRRLIRMKRGQCVKCGYPLGDLAVCTECGSELARRTSQHGMS